MHPSPPRAGVKPRDATQERLRKINIRTLVPPLGAVGILLVVLESKAWWHAVVLSIGVVAGLAIFVLWSSGHVSRGSWACLAITAAVWPVGALAMGAPTAFYGLTIAGSLLIPELPRHRGLMAVGMVCYVSAVGALRYVTAPDKPATLLAEFVVVPTGVAALVAALMFGSKKFYDLVQELDQARERAAELAVMQERMRFAGDLHDIQGHTLHVVKLKITLAEKLLHRDLDRVQEELREVHTLVADTITQTKELAYAQRRLNLSTELENAKNLFEAASIHVRVVREAEADPGVGELLGQVLRETTTNILRHAQARQVHIVLSESGISIVNDGAEDGPAPGLRGLSTLRQRLVDNGGELKVEQNAGRFLTAAGFPRVRQDAVPAMSAGEGSR
ncbi:sensor histidine kinase [Amycolatopsis jiangsuensis]|uniref:Two-component system sensor histidine kinase DesK n=1 Tax=Amycolatopsis jiangsuensis TaxID=1181879 RepID=A0A840IX17_9PSEU|nr:histidine kinase [Amycolatopsis jiangsuensis]MBB4685698.1 two-component system sensor histidine kinase DesK [Amycolatopsis jiangsuensis]